MQLTVTIDDGRGLLVLQDDGIGLPDADALRSAHGIGDVLMRGFADQVAGTLRVDAAPGGGTRISLDFQLEEPLDRLDESSKEAPATGG